MSEKILLRKPKLHFDAAPHPNHVTFDDGKEQRCNFPWMSYVRALWDYAELDTIKIEIGDWLVIVRGHNLGPLFQAVEDHSLARVRAQPGLQNEPEREIDTFAIEIRFTQLPPGSAAAKRRGQVEFALSG